MPGHQVKSGYAPALDAHMLLTLGQGQVTPATAKVEAIIYYPVPSSRREVMRFLGMSGITENFVRTFQVCVNL